MMFVILTIGFLYGSLIFWFLLGMKKIELFESKGLKAITKFSIIVPFRNEAEHLPALLDAINTIDYPESMFEVLFIDDDSNDNSVTIIEHFINANTNLNLFILPNQRQSNSPKKDAITTAIDRTKNDWIITTDADCILPPKWLHLLDERIQSKQPELIAGPVTYLSEHKFLNQFQLLDLHSLQGITIGAFGWKRPFLCNGANLAYKKEAFYDANGFSENDTIASGDDIFLMEKIVKLYPEKVDYLKSQEAIVYTNSQPDWNSLIHQRIRWAAKASAYNNSIGKTTALIVLLINLYLVVSFIGAITLLIPFSFFVFLMGFKLIIDFPILYKTASFFKQKNQLKYYLQSSLLYPFFSFYVAIRSFFFGYKWKDRKFIQ
ncbi:glycosyltransferase [Flavobacteriaceae bacterium R38]|nr:glycosyltransferase [Flavobacteriaceae bacterium R38]